MDFIAYKSCQNKYLPTDFNGYSFIEVQTKYPGSKFWLKFFYDNCGSVEKIAKLPVFCRKITAVTGVS